MLSWLKSQWKNFFYNRLQSILRVLMKNIVMTQEPMEELLLNCLQSILRVLMENPVMTLQPWTIIYHKPNSILIVPQMIHNVTWKITTITWVLLRTSSKHTVAIVIVNLLSCPILRIHSHGWTGITDRSRRKHFPSLAQQSGNHMCQVIACM